MLASMQQGITAIEDRIEPDGGPWFPIPRTEHEAFDRSVAEESLFMDDGSDLAIKLFSIVMSDAVDYEYMDQDKSDSVRRAHAFMSLIKKRLTQHFRNRVGLLSEIDDPLADVYILGACRSINVYHSREFDFPTQGPLSFGDRSAEEIVEVAKKNLPLLRTELQRLQTAMSSRNPSMYFAARSEAERYLELLECTKHPRR